MRTRLSRDRLPRGTSRRLQRRRAEPADDQKKRLAELRTGHSKAEVGIGRLLELVKTSWQQPASGPGRARVQAGDDACPVELGLKRFRDPKRTGQSCSAALSKHRLNVRYAVSLLGQLSSDSIALSERVGLVPTRERNQRHARWFTEPRGSHRLGVPTQRTGSQAFSSLSLAKRSIGARKRSHTLPTWFSPASSSASPRHGKAAQRR